MDNGPHFHYVTLKRKYFIKLSKYGINIRKPLSIFSSRNLSLIGFTETRVDEIRLMINPQMRFAGRMATRNRGSIVTGHYHLILHRSAKYGLRYMVWFNRFIMRYIG